MTTKQRIKWAKTETGYSSKCGGWKIEKRVYGLPKVTNWNLFKGSEMIDDCDTLGEAKEWADEYANEL